MPVQGVITAFLRRFRRHQRAPGEGVAATSAPAIPSPAAAAADPSFPTDTQPAAASATAITADLDEDRYSRPSSSATLTGSAAAAAGTTAPPLLTEMPANSRLIMVSNRLPITITKKGDGSWAYSMSSGGLVSALTGIKGIQFTWFGWPGLDVSSSDQGVVAADLLSKYSAVPVFISDKVADMHYNGFSNSILWPLFHYQASDLNFIQEHWEAYQAANHAFAEALATTVQDGDFVWVHDYQLMLLPSLLRARLADRPNVKIGFFLHIPFPSSEIYRILPVRKEVLVGILQSDLIGFHTYDYARHFLSSCTRILGLATMPNSVEYEGRTVHVGTFPIGIDPEKFLE
ncbi:Trehalose-6-P synthase/phosphatase complex synthase subunit, partial [Cladochytrium tenue]